MTIGDMNVLPRVNMEHMLQLTFPQPSQTDASQYEIECAICHSLERCWGVSVDTSWSTTARQSSRTRAARTRSALACSTTPAFLTCCAPTPRPSSPSTRCTDAVPTARLRSLSIWARVCFLVFVANRHGYEEAERRHNKSLRGAIG